MEFELKEVDGKWHIVHSSGIAVKVFDERPKGDVLVKMNKEYKQGKSNRS